jgi:uncharacterized protein YraI
VFAVHKDADEFVFTRRTFLQAAGAAAAALTLTSCDGAIAIPGSGVTASAVSSETSESPTASHTPELTTTETLEPTATLKPTGTPTKLPPTPTATPLPMCEVTSAQINLRAGPGTAHTIVTTLKKGDKVAVLGRLNDSTWLKVSTAADKTGWLAASLVKCQSDLKTIPVERNVPTAAAPPRATTAPQAQATDVPVPAGVPGNVEAGQTGIEYSAYGQTFTLPCGSPLPEGAICTCNCVTAPSCSCVGHTACSCDEVCTCDTVCTCQGDHYWYPN